MSSLRNTHGENSEEFSELGGNGIEPSPMASGLTQVQISRINDQINSADFKDVMPVENSSDNICSLSYGSVKARYMLAKLRQSQLKQELELDAQRRLLKVNNEVELAKLQMELDAGTEDNHRVHDDVLKFGNGVKEFKTPKNSARHSGIEISAPTVFPSFSLPKIDLPKVELQYFDGNPREYWKFVRQFENYIESRVTDEGQRLLYLVNYCKGRAKKAVEECCLLPVELGYNRAREILRELFGQDYVVARSLIDSLFDDVRPVSFNGDALTQLAIKMQGCEIALSQMGCEADLNALDTLERLVRLLPQPLRIRWARAVDEGQDRPKFSDLRDFIMRESRIARSRFGSIAFNTGHSSQNTMSDRNTDKRRHEVRNFYTNKQVSDDSHRCFVCMGDHKPHDCPTFLSYSVPARWNCLRKNRGCFVCLAKGHRVSECRSLVRCTTAGCPGKHHSLLHSTTPAKKAEANVGNSTNVGCKPEIQLKVLPVGIRGPNGIEFVYALIDSGSDVSLIERDLLIRLGIEEKPTDLKISTVNGSKSIGSGVCELLLTSLDQSETITINRAFSIERVSVRTSCYSLSEAASYWPHLSNIPFGDIPDRRVKLLIGTDVPEAHWVEEQRKGDRKEPFAVKSLLGWMMLGPSVIGDDYVNSVNATTISNDELSEQLKIMYNNEFADTRSTTKGLSIEDKLALQAASSSARLVDGHYEIALPWRQRNMSLGDNRHLALRRILTLRTRFTRDSDFYQKYARAIMQNVEKGYAEPAPMVHSDRSSFPRWYLPHHAVLNPKKPEKFRVVFDCAAKYKGLSLNDMLYSGPDVTTNLADVLLRFRAERVAMAADIEEMFMQVKVPPGDREFLRFLWWHDNDISKSIIEYRMTVHPFGATSSPFCANYALHRAAEEIGCEYPDDVREAITKHFYVDDLLVSLSSIDDARKLAGNLSDLLRKAGFHLRKWISNFPQAFSELPAADLSQANVNLAAENACIERTLGLHWNPVADQFQFTFTQASKEITRRSMLATVASLYDPLGLIGPILLPAKLLLQGLCRQGLTWDDPLPQGDIRIWEAWLKEISTISTLKIPRCVKSLYSPNHPIQLHVFCDASEVGYGAVVYCRCTSSKERHYCSLVIAKSRVAPLKQISIPRLELSAAQLGVRLGESARRCMAVPVDSLTFWTDSTIVLYYIRNRQTRFSTFVANRLSTIHDHSRVEQWRYISSKSNPADLASRGVKRCQDLECWLEGPQFLRLNEASWPSDGPDFADVVGLELKREPAHVNLLSKGTTEALLTHYSDWTRLLRSVIWLTRFKTYIMSLRNKGSVSALNGPLRVVEWKQAEKDVVRMVQKEAFPQIREGYGCGKQSLAKLCPMVIDGIICVGGRLSYRSTSYISKHPPIIPKQHNVTDMIVRYYHLLEGHSGVAHVLASIRRHFWIVKGGATIKRIIGKCLKCRRQLAVPTSQLMAPLPVQRVETGWYPFAKVGLDYFGPFGVKRARSVEKRYGCIFTCLQTRAVHLEFSYGLTTDSFIMALMRFIARRGTPTEVFSDNGSNFVGAAKELGVIVRSFDQRRITSRLTPLGIQWHFQPVASSHRGGIWERLIRSVRRILTVIVSEQMLTDETLHTFLLEVERIMNNRPLVPLYDDIRDADALTPNHLILLRGSLGLDLEGSFADQFRRGFRQASYLAGVFWARWSKEYIPLLQARQKWFTNRRDLRKGDLVLVVTDSIPRGRWPLGIVEESSTSVDGRVRLVTVRTSSGLVTRDIRKICLLEGDME